MCLVIFHLSPEEQSAVVSVPIAAPESSQSSQGRRVSSPGEGRGTEVEGMGSV